MFIVVECNQDPMGGGNPYNVVKATFQLQEAVDFVNKRNENYNGPPGWKPRYDIFGRLTEW